jgi:hypothetical protein
MKDPRRLADDESVSADERDLIASALLPRSLPPEVRARSPKTIHRRLQRKRRQKIVWSMAVSVAVALSALVVGLSPQISPEESAKPGGSIGNSELTRGDAPAQRPPAADSRFADAESRLIPSPAGWLDRHGNRWGAQGAFYVDASSGSTVLEPARPTQHTGAGWLWRNSGNGRLCLKGSSAATPNGDFKTYWGVVAGVELCHTSSDTERPDRSLPIAECPWANFESLRGIRFELEGSRIPSELRVVFSEVDSYENAFVALSDPRAGRHEIRVDEARVSYREPPRPVRRDRMRGVEWLIPSRLGTPAHFEFCLNDIELF